MNKSALHLRARTELYVKHTATPPFYALGETLLLYAVIRHAITFPVTLLNGSKMLEKGLCIVLESLVKDHLCPTKASNIYAC